MLALWVSISYGMPSLWDVKNYGRQLNLGGSKLWEAYYLKVKNNIKRKILLLSKLNIFNVKIKRFNATNKKDFNRIIADCDRETVASIAHYRRLRPRNRRVDTGFILEKKSGAIVGTFIANYRRLRPADGRTLFQFRQLLI